MKMKEKNVRTPKTKKEESERGEKLTETTKVNILFVLYLPLFSHSVSDFVFGSSNGNSNGNDTYKIIPFH